MCGIAGGTGDSPEERRRTVDRQLGLLLHRGPDAQGFVVGRGTVGQTRLAVIDVEHGDPPLTDESGDVRVALNGEIYNFRALQRRLVEGGHVLRTECDTEVVAHLAEELEPVELARALHGMFAFAVWDERRRRLVLGRDRLGKKPLYYWHDRGELVFGSEIKAVLADPRVPRRLREAAVGEYLLNGYVPSPETFYDGVRSVPPGSVLVWQDGRVEVQVYWDVVPGEPVDASEDELARELRRLLEQAVGDRLVADVPLGAFLSGGVDSTAVVGVMAGLSDRPVRTFCVGFEDPRYDERAFARAAARRFGTEHTELVVRPDASALLDDVLHAADQPFADSSALPMLLLCQATRQHVTVALSGDGGDELFAGYDRFAAALALDRAGRVLPGPLTAAARRAGERLAGADLRSPTARLGRLLRQTGTPLPEAYVALVRLVDRPTLRRLGLDVPTAPSHLEAWSRSAGAPTLNRLLDLNRRTYLLDDLLVKADRMSMAHALEVRAPLLDHRLVEFAAGLPPHAQLRGRRTKLLLKRAVADLLPPEVARRPKRGFGVPLDRWFREDLAAETRTRLTASGSRVSRYLDGPGVAALVDEHQRGAAAHGQKLWALLLLERFLEREDW
jgi:asparagine synthase (glutamine-hydrolysing)